MKSHTSFIYGILEKKKKKTQMNVLTKQKETQDRLTVARGKEQSLWEGHVHTTTFKMDNQQKPIV